MLPAAHHSVTITEQMTMANEPLSYSKTKRPIIVTDSVGDETPLHPFTQKLYFPSIYVSGGGQNIRNTFHNNAVQFNTASKTSDMTIL